MKLSLTFVDKNVTSTFARVVTSIYIYIYIYEGECSVTLKTARNSDEF